MKNQVSSPDELTCDVIGSCNPKLIYCPKCPGNKLASSWEYSTRFSWGLSLCCNQCGTIWMICRRCPKVWSCFCFGSDMLRHNKAKHQQDSLQTVGAKRSISEVEDGLDDERKRESTCFMDPAVVSDVSVSQDQCINEVDSESNCAEQTLLMMSFPFQRITCLSLLFLHFLAMPQERNQMFL